MQVSADIIGVEVAELLDDSVNEHQICQVERHPSITMGLCSACRLSGKRRF